MPRTRQRRKRFARLFRLAYLKLLRANATPERVGRGTALGIFIGVLPTLWFGPILAVFAAGPLGANRAAALASMVATGPLMPFIWTLCVLVGNLLVSEKWRVASELLATSSRSEITQRFFATFLVGNLVVGLALALAGYVLVWWLAHRHKQARAARLLSPAAQEESG